MSDSLNKTLLKKFATQSRIELKEKVILKASIYGITSDIAEKDRKTKGVKTFEKNENVVINVNNEKRTLSKEESNQRTALIDKIRRINREDRDGFNEVIEEVAYTWFNRFVALRYMEINGYLPSRINILASRDNTNTPEVLTEAMNVNLPIDKNLVYELKRDNKNEELYRYLVELQCGQLNKSLPFMFEKIGHYAELLFPTGIISSKFFRTLVDTESITEEAWSNVEIIGWLYQYYISDEKDRVIKAKKKYKKNEIPFATQLFTPDWIVRYMVQNSLGRYWVESHEEDSDLKENWEFYLENPEKEPDFNEKIAPYINKDLEVEEIKCFDPACGSGHILVYMFDVLYEIYTRCGYSKGDIPLLIIEKNLYGLDIDTRAYQLACFAVVMKGMSYDKLLLRKIEREVDKRGKYIDLNIACVKETNILFEDEYTTLHENIAFLAKEESGETYDKIKLFVESLKNANTFGSLTKIEGFDKEFLENRLKEINEDSYFENFDNEKEKKFEVINVWGNTRTNNWNDILEDLIKQATIMEQTYDVLVTNPPYMGSKYMNPILIEFINKNYENTKSDLFSAFIEYCFKQVRKEGHIGMITPFVWMFISSYEKLRKYIVENKNISSLIQLEYNSFPEACVPVCTFTLRNCFGGLDGEYIKLSDFKGIDVQLEKTLNAVNNCKCGYRYHTRQENFTKIPGMPIAYWVSEKFVSNFSGEKVSDYFVSGGRNKTHNNEKYLRLWWEIKSNGRWQPYDKGGDFRRWYGNHQYLVDWSESAKKEYDSHGGLYNQKFANKAGICWSLITSNNTAFRVKNSAHHYDSASPVIFNNDYTLDKCMLGFLNTNVAQAYLNLLNPTINMGNTYVLALPLKKAEYSKEIIEECVDENVSISKTDWDSFETSWNFKKHPFLTAYKFSRKQVIQEESVILVDTEIKKSFEIWTSFTKKQFDKLKYNEEKLNRIFIDVYGLQGEVIHEINDEDITIQKSDLYKDIRSFISYVVGCMFGRYSLDKEGLIFDGGEFDINQYSKFIPNSNNIIPALNSDSNYFEDDVMIRFEEFLKVTFSGEYLEENIDFIADAIGKKNNESSREAIRKYFANEFFAEHCKMYKKRPIYWLFTSGKNKAFSCLVYQHRIDKNLLSKMRIDYVQPLQNKLEVEQKDAMYVLESDATALDKKEAKKKLALIEKQIDELRKFHDKLRTMADKQIEIDLDDGVVHNHSLFGELVAKIK